VGEEVILLSGLYAATGSVNRNLNCAGKVITIRAEVPYGAVIDGTSAGSAQCVSSSADPAGSVISGLVAINWTGGSGGGFAVTGGFLTLRQTAAFNCAASNSGAGYRVAAGSPTIEDYYAENCLATGNGGGGVYTNTGSTATFRRGRIVKCNATANVGGGVRNSGAGTIFDGLEVFGCTGTAGAGFAASASCRLTNYTAAGNVSSGGGHDLWVNNGQVVTGDSWVLWSPDVSTLFPVNLGTTGAIRDLSNSTSAMFSTIQGGASGARFGNGAGWTNVSSADPLFTDLAGGNLQLKPASPARGAGVQRAGMWDAFNRPFGHSAATAHQGAWA
jgi:hypothetical protein